MEISVRLKNPPAGGDIWQLLIANASKTDSRFIQHIPMDGIANFTIPDTWDFPLPIALIVYQWIVPGESVRQIYEIQSFWGPDHENYAPIFIRLPGNWHFNFLTEEFEYVYQGTITDLELVYDGRGSVPIAVDVPQGTGKLYINVRNDIVYPEVIGAAWEVKDPDGIVIENGKFLTPEPFSPGMSQGLFSNLFSLSKLGKYTTKVEMLMTIDEFVVDSYEGDLCAVTEKIAGTISKKELEYDEARADIPAYDIPQDKRGLVHIWGRNDMDSNQRMGITWIIKDPDGYTVEEYAYWEAFWTGPGNEQRFIGDRFDINKPGIWVIGVGLYMNPDAPVLVDSYTGVLCTVAPEIYKATISKKELEYDESRSIIPVY